MGDDVLNPGWFSEEAQRDPAWLEWARPERISAQVDKLLTETLPGLPGLEAMPDADRYSDEMLGWVGDGFEVLFPDAEALFEVENSDVADQFVCYLGEVFVHRAGGEWFNDNLDEGSVIYDMKFTPAIGYRYDAPCDDISDLLFRAAEAEDGPDWGGEIGSEIYSRTIDYADAHGSPHEFHEVRKQHGLA